TIDLTDEHLSKLAFNSVNNITIELGTVAGGKILDKTVTFTKGNTKPKLNITSYNSTSATFTAIDTDNNLSKIEWFIDDVLKETITTDLATEKTINYELTDNAIHTLKIVATDAENATVEKVLSISKEIMPLQSDATLQDISTKLVEIGEGFKNGKTSIINTLALKNVEANLNNTLVELSEKIKLSFDSGDASLQELQNKITELNNQLSQRKRYARGVYTFTQNDVDTFYSEYRPTPLVKTLTVPINLSFIPRLIVVEGIYLYSGYTAKFYAINNVSKVVGRIDKNEGKDYAFMGYMFIQSVSSSNFIIQTYRDGKTDSSSSIYRCDIGEGFIWQAYE
ncbi:hypothetical protein ACTPDI_15810, partial [Clostridioides difficile]